MISWLYIIPAVMFGAIAGILLVAILNANHKDEE